MNDCIFCRVVRGELPSSKVYENDNVLAFFDVNPVSEYHTLVIPKKHYKDVFEIPEEDLLQITSAIKNITSLLKEKVGIENVQIINSSGSQAQQDVFHIHFHIVPRRTGDNQDIHWTPRTELGERFTALLEKLQ
ncbi:MAG: histidine triad family protein [Candidatus Parcubacteria bacterium]|jgi:histidine triad (HIT) family protein|nr:histidine triad family protein [Candidatus Parcubacteria bacterium]